MSNASPDAKADVLVELGTIGQKIGTCIAVSIKGMDCSSCALSIETTVSALRGVLQIKVSPMTEEGEVAYDPTVTNTNDILSKITELGYPASVRAPTGDAESGVVSLVVKDVTPATEGTICKVLERTIGVRGVSISRPAKAPVTFDVKYDLNRTGARTLIAALTANGYSSSLASAESGSKERNDSKEWKTRFWWSLMLCIPVIVFAYILPVSGDATDPVVDDFTSGLSVSTLVSWILATPIQLWICWPLFISAYRAARYGKTANMDTLVVLSTGTAYLYSLIATVTAIAGRKFSGEVFFETTAVLITLIMFGRTVEVVVRGKATQILRCMMELQASNATLLVAKPKGDTCCSSESGDTQCHAGSGHTHGSDDSGHAHAHGGDHGDDSKHAHAHGAGDTGHAHGHAHAPGEDCTHNVKHEHAHGSDDAGHAHAHGGEHTGDSKHDTQASTADHCCSNHGVEQTAAVSPAAKPAKPSAIAVSVFLGKPQTADHCADDGCCEPLLCAEGRCCYASGEVTERERKLQKEVAVMTEQSVELRLVQRGDILKVLPGTKIPTDGIVILGTTTVDESMVTGESIPVVKKVGDTVFGSTINQNSLIHIRVTKILEENALSAISKLVEQAQNSKPPVQRIADRIAAYFVPIIIALSLSAFVNWCALAATGVVDAGDLHPVTFGLQFALATLVVSCPCAVGLAVPTAVMAATGVGAKLGIVFKSGAVLEACRNVDAIVFDKTGTLTVGKPAVASVFRCADEKNVASGGKEPESDSEFWFYIGSAQTGSEHIIAKAIVNHSRHRSKRELVPPSEFTATPGKGVKCVVDGRRVVMGTEDWMSENALVVSEAVHKETRRLEDDACTIVYVAFDGRCVAVLGLLDQLKPESKSVVAQLTLMGIEAWMISGDTKRTAAKVGSQLNIPADRVVGRVLPGDKAVKVAALQKSGKRVAMVGDGINDSPALAQADVGFAVASGTDMALAAASVLLLKHDLRDVLVAIDLSRTAFRRIKYNLGWAFVYNVAAITLAIGVWYPLGHVYIPPALAGLSELFSSIPVVIGSILLQRYRIPVTIKPPM